MKGLAIAVLLACVLLCGAAKKKKQLSIQVMETSARRGEETISLDGRVRNSGDRPIQKLILLFDFIAPGGAVISTQQFPVEESVLEPGTDTVFRAKLNDNVRAVRYRVGATDSVGREFLVSNPGPYVIE